MLTHITRLLLPVFMHVPGDVKKKSVYLLSACKVILVVGGQVGGHGPYADMDTIGIVESFDPLTCQRKILAPLPKPLSHQGLVVLGKEYHHSFHSLAPPVLNHFTQLL